MATRGSCSLLVRTKMTEFNFELALSLYNSNDPFPVNYGEEGWQWIGYASKGKAKRKLVNNFTEGVDYTITRLVKTKEDGSFSHYYEEIKTTVPTFKELGMMAGTEKGKQIRQHFLRCEDIVKNQHSYFDARFLEMETRLNNSMINALAPLVDKITKFEQSCKNHKGAGQVVKSTTEEKEYSGEILTVNEYCARRGLARELWNTFRRRYGDFVRVGKGLIPPKKNGRLAITGIFFEYADVVLANVMEFV